jgi:hypothetical protein
MSRRYIKRKRRSAGRAGVQRIVLDLAVWEEIGIGTELVEKLDDRARVLVPAAWTQPRPVDNKESHLTLSDVDEEGGVCLYPHKCPR